MDKIVDCKVVDYAKCGHGNERLYRKVYEQVSDESFNKDEVLFLFEISSIGRKAIYSAEFKKWGIYNYQFDSENDRLDLKKVVMDLLLIGIKNNGMMKSIGERWIG